MRSRCTSPRVWPTTAPGRLPPACGWRAIGSSSFYTAATVDNAPILVAAELVTGQPMLNPVWDPSSPGLLLLVGTNPVVSHGYGTTLPDPVRYLRDFRASGGSVWVLDPRRTETAALADVHVPVRPGSDVEVLAAIAGALLRRRRRSDRAGAARTTSPRCGPPSRRSPSSGRVAAAGVPEAALRELVTAVRAHPGRVAVFCGTGHDDGPRRRRRRVAALGDPRADGLARPSGWHAFQPWRRQPVAAAARRAAGAARAPQPTRPAAASRDRCRASPSPTRSRPATSASSSSPAATRWRRSPSRTGSARRWRRSTCSS